LRVTGVVGDRDSYRTTHRSVSHPGYRRRRVIGIVRRADGYHRRTGIHTAAISRGDGIAGRIGNCRCHRIRTINQRGTRGDTVDATQLNRRDHGLRHARAICDRHGNSAADRCIGGAGDGRCRIAGVVRGADVDSNGDGAAIQDDAAIEGIERPATIGAELVGKRINSFNDTQEFDEGVAFVATRAGATCSGVFKQGIKIAARAQRLGDCLEAFFIVANSTVCAIRLDRGADFGVEPGCLTRLDSHFAAVGQLEYDLGAIGSHYGLTLANGIPCLEAAHTTGIVPGIGFT